MPSPDLSTRIRCPSLPCRPLAFRTKQVVCRILQGRCLPCPKAQEDQNKGTACGNLELWKPSTSEECAVQRQKHSTTTIPTMKHSDNNQTSWNNKTLQPNKPMSNKTTRGSKPPNNAPLFQQNQGEKCTHCKMHEASVQSSNKTQAQLTNSNRSGQMDHYGLS